MVPSFNSTFGKAKQVQISDYGKTLNGSVNLLEWIGYYVLAKKNGYYYPGVIRSADNNSGSIVVEFYQYNQFHLYCDVMNSKKFEVISDQIPSFPQVTTGSRVCISPRVDRKYFEEGYVYNRLYNGYIIKLYSDLTGEYFVRLEDIRMVEPIWVRENNCLMNQNMYNQWLNDHGMMTDYSTSYGTVNQPPPPYPEPTYTPQHLVPSVPFVQETRIEETLALCCHNEKKYENVISISNLMSPPVKVPSLPTSEESFIFEPSPSYQWHSILPMVSTASDSTSAPAVVPTTVPNFGKENLTNGKKSEKIEELILPLRKRKSEEVIVWNEKRTPQQSHDDYQKKTVEKMVLMEPKKAIIAEVKPKRSGRRPNPFTVFCKKYRPFLKGRYPSCSQAEILRILKRSWEEFDLEEKMQFSHDEKMPVEEKSSVQKYQNQVEECSSDDDEPKLVIDETETKELEISNNFETKKLPVDLEDCRPFSEDKSSAEYSKFSKWK